MVPRFAYPYRQRGAIGLMAAITLGMALLFMLLVIDSGRLYLEQRKLQRVVDAAALEASNLNAVCSGTGVNALSQATTSAARNGFTVGTGNTLTATCGTLSTGSNNLRAFTANATATQAIQVVANETVATSVAAGLWGMVAGGGFNANTVLRATATAGYVGGPLAQLNIRSTLASVSTSQSAALNGLFSGLLGGNVSLSAVGWNSLLTTNVNLLSYMNQLATNLHITAGDYSAVLSANTTVGQLISTAATVLSASGASLDVTSSLASLSAAATLSQPITLGELLQLQAGADATALNAGLQVFELVQAIAQLSSSSSGLSASVPVSLLGLANVTTTLKVVEPPQFSAVGNPASAKAAPLGTGKIYVRTAQVRLLTSINLPLVDSILSGLQPTLNFLVGALSTAAKVLPSCLLGGTCISSTLTIIPSTEIDLGMEIGSGYAYVTDYSCPPAAKTLTAQGSSSPLTVSLGQIDSSQFLSSSTDYTVSPIVLVNVATTTCQNGACGNPVQFGGGGLEISIQKMMPLSTTNEYANIFSNPPNVGSASTTTYAYQANTNVVGGLTSAINSIKVQYVTAQTGGVLTTLLASIVSLLTGAVSGLTSVLGSTLSALIDPLVNSLLTLLGIDVNQINVGANLTCQTGRAQLVL